MENQSQTFVGILRAVKSEGVEGQSGEDPNSEVQKTEWEGLPENIWKVCEEFVVVFRKDLPKGVPPRRMGHEFKIDLEPDTTPIHRPIYSSAHSSFRRQSINRLNARTWLYKTLSVPMGCPVYLF